MNKNALINELCKRTFFTHKVAQEMVEELLAIIKETVHNNQEVRIKHFGTFTTTLRKARKGVNPSTKEDMIIPERMIFKFKPAASVKTIQQP